MSLAVAATIIYYGIGIAGVYLRYWQLLDEMQSAARLAPNLDDATIRRRLHDKAADLDLPPAAHRFSIRRLASPREIRITTSYEETVQLPFTTYTFHLKPQARATL